MVVSAPSVQLPGSESCDRHLPFDGDDGCATETVRPKPVYDQSGETATVRRIPLGSASAAVMLEPEVRSPEHEKRFCAPMNPLIELQTRATSIGLVSRISKLNSIR